MFLVIKDYFIEFSKLIENQKACAALLTDFFEGVANQKVEEEYRMLAKRSMEEILDQKRMGLLPAEKEQACMILSELVFRSQLTLLHIPELFRIYRAEDLKEPFAVFLPEICGCCLHVYSFALPEKAGDRFQKERAEPIFECCLEGFKKCKQFGDLFKASDLRGMDMLLFKDIDEEFASFFLLNLKFAHCALHFPI